ncbi:hypothetical protein M9Y10_039936 [Tritrichomonas musculus]|uniref:HECT-type E3 ubiquitin transferase n=1 Tax=Tritrichomonas musculus TaxID=1915356 RepID=A0ABR2GQA5_9EUKA
MSGSPIKIVPDGDKEKFPQAQTCFNILKLPEYESEEELNRKLLLAIQQYNTFENYYLNFKSAK